jgi:hypothetical protein
VVTPSLMRHSMRLRFLQQGKDLLPLHTGKTFEKVCNGVTGFKMVKQTLNRYPGPSKDRLASENFRVPRNDFLHGNIIPLPQPFASQSCRRQWKQQSGSAYGTRTRFSYSSASL